jgi:hypothetical protein
MPIQPALCIAAASFIHSILITNKVRKNFRVIFGSLIAAIVIFGVIGIGSLITLDLSAFQFESFFFTGKLLANGTNNSSQVSDSKKQHENGLQGDKIGGHDLDKLTIISSPIYSWVFKYVFDYGERAHASYLEGKIVKMDHVVLIVDRYFRDYLMTEYQPFQNGNTSTPSDFEQLVQIDNEAKTLVLFDGITSKFDRFSYPFTSLRYNFGGSPVEVKVR